MADVGEFKIVNKHRSKGDKVKTCIIIHGEIDSESGWHDDWGTGEAKDYYSMILDYARLLLNSKLKLER